MPETSIAEAKAQLTRLIHRAERGETLHITRRGKPVAALLSEEVLYGMFRLPRGTRRDQIDGYLFQRIRPVLPILGFDERAAGWQAEQRARLRRTGRSPSYPDSQIAAIAVVNDLALVTRNVEDFADFQGLHVENWFE